ncbi:methyltransferase family protein [Lutibacter oceani]|uniref:Methyltransferase family protein n=1 Tax=Lutibacter oceani TaxID=1853311 RepID=A0A3D9RR81_9FLAO|nr:class I SAM-dependent methyltransferase [Lutibacter oceani]REE81998.1 methyltransferase family protein [Lutibacter oceani]
MRYKLKKINNTYQLGKRYLNDFFHTDAYNKNVIEKGKTPSRTDVINYLVSKFNREVHYLEIGVRYPDHNFNKINAKFKYSVDPGVENKANPVKFKLTSDEFFSELKSNKILITNNKFDIIFIDGLHQANQVERDILNSLEFLSEDGFIIVHDCNPPTESHARETYEYVLSPSGGSWNGTTWKAFYKFRKSTTFFSCCIDSDWGIGIISKKIKLGEPTKINNPFFEFQIFDKNRVKSLNLISFENFMRILEINTKS